MQNSSDDYEKKEAIAILHRQIVIARGSVVWTLMFGLSIYGFFLNKLYLIIVAVIVGCVVVWIMSVMSANKVEKLTGLSHKNQAIIWFQYKSSKSE